MNVNAYKELVENLNSISCTFMNIDKITPIDDYAISNMFGIDRGDEVEMYYKDDYKEYNKFVKAAMIKNKNNTYYLHTNYTPAELETFLILINFIYYNDYGEDGGVVGYVWLDDGSWFERDSYDGLESWKHKQCPTLPNRK
jgi:hypothetical protein